LGVVARKKSVAYEAKGKIVLPGARNRRHKTVKE
jgi:hypothetical protein